MKNFELTITRRKEDKIVHHEKIEADDLVEILSKLLLEIAKIQNTISEELVDAFRYRDDDIPF